MNEFSSSRSRDTESASASRVSGGAHGSLVSGWHGGLAIYVITLVVAVFAGRELHDVAAAMAERQEAVHASLAVKVEALPPTGAGKESAR